MRYWIAFLAVAGAVIAALALHVHYSTELEPCSINEKWDCGIVNHSPYAVVAGIPLIGRVPGLQQAPVAAVGIAGYTMMLVLVLARLKKLVLVLALVGLGFSLYLTHIEKDVLMVWCIYCVTSLGIISLITLSTLAWLAMGKHSVRG